MRSAATRHLRNARSSHAALSSRSVLCASKCQRISSYSARGTVATIIVRFGPPKHGQKIPMRRSMRAARSRVLKATKDAKIYFLNSCNDKNVVEMIKEGVMICTGRLRVGRKFTNAIK